MGKFIFSLVCSALACASLACAGRFVWHALWQW